MKPAFRKLTLPVSNSFVVKTDDIPLKNPWHYHPEVELVYFYEGRGTRFIGDSICGIKNRELILIGTNLPHTFQRDQHFYQEHAGQKPLLVITQFLPEFLGREFFRTPEFQTIQRLLIRAGRGLFFTGKEPEILGERLMELRALSPSMRILELISILLELSEIDDCTYLSSEGFVNIYAELHHTRLNKVYEHSVNHFMERISVETVADLANLTPASFCRFFKARSGRTYHDYLTDLRIGFACKLLAENKFNVSEVARQSGFRNLSLFNRQFKELKGVTPTEYQIQLMQSN